MEQKFFPFCDDAVWDDCETLWRKIQEGQSVHLLIKPGIEKDEVVAAIALLKQLEDDIRMLPFKGDR